ncbi:AsmA family protein [Pseudoduganella sp. FT25W]|uniref:AsmA family protein n=1 Tax=Duganella alba TaxID=2666081 RepID=A0A6L5QHF7_9BURK|nr:AsmA family protein [Duganella alba]MRX08948.1 AsmA family protein [Duganella alba]MRX19006.1 AsmA family protein [Duganella alba]
MPSATSLPRRTKIAIAVGGIVIAVPVVAAAVLASYDWNKARPWLNQRISAAIARPFEIRGAVSLAWRNEGEFLPMPHLVARDVHVGNPRGMSAPDELASVGQFAFAVELLPLLRQRIEIPELRFDNPKLLLQREADGKNNWTFKREDKESVWSLDVQRVVFTKGTVRYIDAMTHVDASAQVDTINDPRYGVSWQLSGKWNNQDIQGSGKAGAVLSLQKQTAPFPLAASLNVGGTSISFDGTLTKPAALTALDMRLKLSGPSMARLYGLTGVLLPETPPFVTEGHLTGNLGANASHWIYDQFTGKVGASDIAGKLDFKTGAPRSVLSGNIQSKLLQVSDLGPLIGADSNASKEARGAEELQPGNKVLPVENFRTDRWTAIDADVNFKAARITRNKDLPIQNLETQIHLKDGVLALKPMNFDIAGGRFTSNIVLDGSGKVNAHAIRADLKAKAAHLQLKQLFPSIEGMQATVGEINADVALTATGNSVASLLGASNGEFKGVVNEGSVSKLLLEAMGLNLGSVALTKLVGDKQVKLNCMVTDFAVSNGVMNSRLFVADTSEARIDVHGTVNLGNEKLDLTLKPDAKSVRVISLRAPIYVRGTFKQPDISIDKGSLALRAGSALALAVVAPVAAIVPLVSTSSGETAGCQALIAQAGKPQH